MKILYVAYKFDYGIPSHGYSFEHWNFYSSLSAMGNQLTYLDVGSVLADQGRIGLQNLLQKEVDRTLPDLVFFFLYQDEFNRDAIKALTDRGVPTFNWFADDHWRFDDFSATWASCFTLVSTTAASAVHKYGAMGIPVHKTQWAANTDLYKPSQESMTHDVTFIGQVYGDRQAYIANLRASGFAVEAFGTGWSISPAARRLASRRGIRRLGGGRYLTSRGSRTRVDQERMISLFSTSRINLNLTDASQGAEPQIKGRNFEVPACGGFLLTQPALDLEQYYEPGKEVALLESPDELATMVAFYLANPEQRASIATAGYKRTLAEHTYRQRFSKIFSVMGLPPARHS